MASPNPCHATCERDFLMFLEARARSSVTPSHDSRARESFQGCLPQSSLKKLGQILTPLPILGHFERFSPGPNGSEVGCPARLGFGPNFSAMIEAGNPENFRSP